jgi:hypothetical protein
MRALSILAVGGIALTSSLAFARDGEQRFTHEGNTYVYNTTVENGRTVISGSRLPGGDAFRLVIDGDKVTGVAGGTPVAFRASSAKGAAAGVQLAAK